MSDNNNEPDFEDDFDSEDFDDAGFDDYKDHGTLGDLWRNNPFVKVGVILAVVVFIIGGIILFGGKKEELPTSKVARSEDVTEAPGTAEVTESFRQAVEEENTRRVEEALRESTSAVPMPVDPPKGTLPLQVEEEPQEDPLERWRRMQEERVRQQQIIAEQPKQVQPQPEPEEDTRTPAVNALSQAMVQQMELILQNQPIKGANTVQITSKQYLDNLALQEQQRQEQLLQTAAQQQSLPGGQPVQNILIPAATVEYAQLVTEANTDAPGPILAQILSGPLRGSRMLGTFESTERYLTLNFNTIVTDGISYPANAVAMDPDTSLPGVITEIDNRYFKRIILPAAAAFVEGLGEAISDSGTTSVFIEGDTVTETTSDRDSREEAASGIAEAGEAFAEILDEEADRTRPMLRVARGTPIGILFIDPVVEQTQ